MHNIPGGPENNDEAYNLARLGAKVNWWALRLNASLDYLLPKNWLGRLRVSGQYTDQVLIPGEQFGIGGQGSVRGFNERVVSGDLGLSGGLDLWTPKLPYDLRLLGFLDGGVVQNADPLPGEIPSVTLASTGLGLRWYWNNQLSVEADLAYILQGIREPADLDAAPGDTKLHFGIVYRW